MPCLPSYLGHDLAAVQVRWIISCLSPRVAVSLFWNTEAARTSCSWKAGRCFRTRVLVWLAAPASDLSASAPHSACPHPTVVGCVSGLDLRANLLSEGSAYFSRFHVCGRQAELASAAGVGREVAEKAQVKGVMMPKRGLVRASPAFPHGITIFLNKK